MYILYPLIYKKVLIQYNYLITDVKNKYSVPFDLIGQEISVRPVEAFYQGSRVASTSKSKTMRSNCKG